jgi:hypothetical protein
VQEASAAPVVVTPAPAIASASSAITSTPLSATGEAAAPMAAAPTREGPSTANIAEFALSTSHAVGQQMYRRTNMRASNDRACGRFASDSLAQEAFLDAGGPERDRFGVDPDGDGYACNWDPAAFRLARG